MFGSGFSPREHGGDAPVTGGIYAVMSFTVTRRTREIGIRVALGASRRRVVAAVFARPLAQVGVGVVAGACHRDVRRQRAPAALAGAWVLGAHLGVVPLACIVPRSAHCRCSRPRRCERTASGVSLMVHCILIRAAPRQTCRASWHCTVLALARFAVFPPATRSSQGNGHPTGARLLLCREWADSGRGL